MHFWLNTAKFAYNKYLPYEDDKGIATHGVAWQLTLNDSSSYEYGIKLLVLNFVYKEKIFL